MNVMIPTTGGRKIAIKAIESKIESQLMIHHPLVEVDHALTQGGPRSGWVIAHKKSGLRFPRSFDKFIDAIHFLQVLAGAPWDKMAEGDKAAKQDCMLRYRNAVAKQDLGEI